MDNSTKEGVFVELYAKHQGELFRYVAALVPHLQDAEDVLGDVTVTLWKSFGDFKSGSNFLAWARQVAHYRVLKYYRARDRRLTLPQRLLEKLAADLTAREKADDLRLKYLQQCKQELSSADLFLLDQRYVYHKKVQDLARHLGQSDNAVSKSLGRIRRLLLACIDRKTATDRQSTVDDR